MHVCRDTYPRLYSNDERVITAAAGLSIVYAVYQTLTSLNFTLGGILNGCGRQQISANIGTDRGKTSPFPLSFYACPEPVLDKGSFL
jgi:Na+-driven multidrug efflux pump